VTAIERIAYDTAGPSRAGHELRYRLAGGYIEPGEIVLDAACGIGYGARFAPHAGEWVGVDIADDVVHPEYEPLGQWVTADLGTWEPDFSFDVAVSFETIEHVESPERLIDVLCHARRLVVCSVPIIPTTATNSFHLHDFTMFDLPRVFDARGWTLHQFLLQPGEMSGIYVFAR
jgi:SAM-dependent methyltransferase